MTKHSKLLEKLLNNPNSFTYDELVRLLKSFGYDAEMRGRSNGSAVMFFNKVTKDKIMIHRPHPQKEIKQYIIKMVIEKLRQNKLI